MPEREAFEERYWTERSQYRKFDDYPAALEATMGWYAGLLRLVRRELPDSGRVLDAGCGHGAMVHLLAARGFSVTGVDLSRWVIEAARAHAPSLAGAFRVGDAATLEEGERYDLIVCLEVVEHVEDPVAMLAGFRERLVPGGRLLATTPNLRPLIPWWDPLTSDPTHVSVHEPAWWRGAVREAGLEPHRVSTFLTLPLIWRLGPAFSRWIPLGSRTGPGVLIAADRPR